MREEKEHEIDCRCPKCDPELHGSSPSPQRNELKSCPHKESVIEVLITALRLCRLNLNNPQSHGQLINETIDPALILATIFSESQRAAPSVAGLVEKAVEEEQTRWQDAIDKVIHDNAPKANIDGGGCESGDPLDGTLAELGQAFAHWDNRAFDALQEMGLSADGYPCALEALIDIFPNDSVDVDTDGQRTEIKNLRKQLRFLISSPSVAEGRQELELQMAYGRGVSAGKLEALQYTPEERERYGKWAAQGGAFDLSEKDAATATTDKPKIGNDFYNGMEFLACWLIDHAEGETITEELSRQWAIEAWREHEKSHEP